MHALWVDFKANMDVQDGAIEGLVSRHQGNKAREILKHSSKAFCFGTIHEENSKHLGRHSVNRRPLQAKR